MERSAEYYERQALAWIRDQSENRETRSLMAQVYATLAQAAAISEQTEAQRPVRMGIG